MKNERLFKEAKKASGVLGLLEVDQINEAIRAVAKKALEEIPLLISENEKDLSRMEPTNPKFDRLKLTKERIESIAHDMENIALLDYPVGKILEKKTISNGLEITKITVPIGVIGIIYEARPNVTFDCFSLCIKSGNAVVLKGGSDAEFSNKAIIKIIQEVLNDLDIYQNIVQLLPTDREATTEMLNAVGFVDLLIPRGSQNLIDFVRQNAKVPVIETGAGIVHAYFDEFGDLEKGRNIINNSKTRRVSVCNALDTLVIHDSRLQDLPELAELLEKSNVTIYADQPAFAILNGNYPPVLLQPATDESYGTEFLDYKIAIKTVGTFDEAVEHISKHSSKHSEVIISENEENINLFLKVIDAAAVYANASTAFTDGGEFGLGAEIGISTQKIHARGPMGLAELTSYKWLVKGNGQIRA